MKIKTLFFVLSLLQLSSFSYADGDDQIKVLAKAIEISFSVKDLDCINLEKNKKFPASNFYLGPLNSGNTQVEIIEGKQPSIIFHYADRPQGEDLAFRYEITTNNDRTIVEKLKVVKVLRHRDEFRNVGTITQPKLEKVFKETVLQEIIICQ